MGSTRTALIALVLMLGIGVQGLATAHPLGVRHTEIGRFSHVGHPVLNQGRFSRARAAQRTRARYGGRVLSIRHCEHHPGPCYVVQLLDHGDVRLIHVSPGSTHPVGKD